MKTKRLHECTIERINCLDIAVIDHPVFIEQKDIEALDDNILVFKKVANGTIVLPPNYKMSHCSCDAIESDVQMFTIRDNVVTISPPIYYDDTSAVNKTSWLCTILSKLFNCNKH